jgi:hypothetical protein
MAKPRLNRDRFPIVATWVDILRTEFPELRVVHVREGAEEAGHPLDVVWVPWRSTTTGEDQ